MLWSIPLIIVGSFIFGYPRAYRALALAAAARRRSEEEDLVRALNIPETVRPPRDYPDVRPIDLAQKVPHTIAVDQMIDYRSRALLMSALPVLAVGFTALGVLYGHTKAPLAASFAIAEAALLGCLMWLVTRRREPTREWVLWRMRSEMLRREQYLCLGLIGPYRGRSESDRQRLAASRIDQISVTTIAENLEFGTPETCTWGACHVGGDKTVALEPFDASPLSERLNSYYWYRLKKQLVWYSIAARRNQSLDHSASVLLKILLVAAFAASLAYLATFFIHGDASTDFPHLIAEIAFCIALFSPPACTIIVAAREIYSFRLLGILYRRTVHALKCNIDELGVLQSAVATAGATVERLEQFQYLVAKTETRLAEEYCAWETIVHREEFETAV